MPTKRGQVGRVNLGLIGRVSSCHSSHSGLSPHVGWVPTHKPPDSLHQRDQRQVIVGGTEVFEDFDPASLITHDLNTYA
ncbi:hypothetical protein FRC0088_01983 [Corynebacterium diphtheriae]|nr:hypothetical protein FRC0088_01983 [Corynebacterium diphtheriae]